MDHSTISDNVGVANGGGLFSDTGSLTLDSDVISGNMSNQAGGGIYTNSGSLTLDSDVITANTSDQAGGGLYMVGSKVSIENSSVVKNKAAQGAGIDSEAYTALNLVASTISQNSASGNGGGMYLDGPSTYILNSTVSNNQAASGGGIYNYYQTYIASSTISMNTATSDGGGVDGAYMLTTKNTLIAANSAKGNTADCEGRFTSHGFNLIGSGDGCNGFTNGVNGDQVGTTAQPIDPLLGPLQDNGGPTFTMALLPGSPALNAANPFGCTDDSTPPQLLTTDQRGYPRPNPNVGRCDIGAFEYQGTPPSTPTPTASTTATNSPTITRTPTATPTITPTATATAGGFTYHIPVGWSLIALPGAPTTPVYASGLLVGLLFQSKGSIAALYGLTNNAWSPYLINNHQNGTGLSGQDFALQQGVGYLLYSDRKVDFTVSWPGGHRRLPVPQRDRRVADISLPPLPPTS
jgi:hypothetical protein